jgi:hypothetical protein
MTDIVKIAIIANAGGIISALVGVFNRVKLGDIARKADGLTDHIVKVEKKISYGEGVEAGKEQVR